MVGALSEVESHARPGPVVFFRVNRGGGAFTVRVNQRGGSLLAAAAFRAGIAPWVLSVLNLMLGLGTAVALTAAAPVLAAAPWPVRAVAAVAAWLSWQAAYCLDCADGQLARVAGKATPTGAVVDVMCDVGVQVCFAVALTQLAATWSGPVEAWQGALWGATWMVTAVTSQLDKSGADVTLLPGRSVLLSLVKSSRDYGVQISGVALVLALLPDALGLLAWVFAFVNGAYVLASVARAARRSALDGRTPD